MWRSIIDEHAFAISLGVLDVSDADDSNFEYWSPIGADYTKGDCALGHRVSPSSVLPLIPLVLTDSVRQCTIVGSENLTA